MQGYNPDWSGIMQSQLMQGQAMAGLGQQLGGILGQRRQQKQDQAANQQMMTDINAAMYSGSPEQIAMVSIKYPQAREALDASMKFKDQQTKQNFIETTFGMLSDPASAEAKLKSRIDYLDSIGADSTQTRGRLNMLRKDPDRFMSVTEGMAAAIAPEQYNAWKKSRPSTPKPMTEYQELTLEDKRANTKLRAEEARLRRLQQEASYEYNDLKRQDLEAKIAEKELKIQELRNYIETARKEKAADLSNAIGSASDTLSIVDRVLNSPGFEAAVGAKGASSLFGLFENPIAGTEAADTAALIDTLDAKNFLVAIQQMKGMGALSNAEGEKVSRAVQSLSRNQTEGQLRKNLEEIKSITKRAIDSVKARSGAYQKQYPSSPDVGSVIQGYKFLGGDPASPSSWEKQ